VRAKTESNDFETKSEPVEPKNPESTTGPGTRNEKLKSTAVRQDITTAKPVRASEPETKPQASRISLPTNVPKGNENSEPPVVVRNTESTSAKTSINDPVSVPQAQAARDSSTTSLAGLGKQIEGNTDLPSTNPKLEESTEAAGNRNSVGDPNLPVKLLQEVSTPKNVQM
jgi:hypothetical protein